MFWLGSVAPSFSELLGICLAFGPDQLLSSASGPRWMGAHFSMKSNSLPAPWRMWPGKTTRVPGLTLNSRSPTSNRPPAPLTSLCAKGLLYVVSPLSKSPPAALHSHAAHPPDLPTTTRGAFLANGSPSPPSPALPHYHPSLLKHQPFPHSTNGQATQRAVRIVSLSSLLPSFS